MRSELNVLFGHDHTFYRDDEGNVFSGGGLPAIVWDRYLSVFRRITVVGRDGGGVSDEQSKKLALSSRDSVSFSLIENISTLKAKVFGNSAVNAVIKDLVSINDCVIARLSSEIGLLLIAEARRQNKPYAIELVDCPFDALWNFGSIKSKAYAPVLAWQVRKALSHTLFSLYVTKDFLQKRYPSPNAISIDCSNVYIQSPTEPVINRRKERLSSSAALRLGLIGSLHGNLKGVDTAIKAIAVLKKKGVNLTLNILGAGDSARFYHQAKSLGVIDRVFFDGVLPTGDAVLQWLDNIDIYIHPSLKEGLPRSLIEAMSRGCPAIATAVAGTPELLTPDFLIKRNDYLALADKVQIFAESLDLRKQQSLINFTTSKRYDSKILAKKRTEFWVKFYNYVESEKEE